MSGNGERGDTGQRGVAGERGPKGDHGQHGESGKTGAAGAAGAAGEAGATGATGKTEPTRIWFGWTKWTWATLAFLFIIFVGAFSLYRVQELSKDFARDREQAAIERGRLNCESINVTTEKIRRVVTIATAGNTGPDYTQLSEFKALDRDMQAFLIALRDRSASTGSSALRDQLLVGLDLRDCEAEYRAATTE